MIIKKVIAKSILDSRRKPTIQVIVKTDKGRFITSAPCGKSTGKYEAKAYANGLNGDIKFINKLDVNNLIIDKFDDLNKVEKIVNGRLGANSLFALEACLLKSLAKEKGKELYELLSLGKGRRKKLLCVGNAIGGGLHSKGRNGKKPDFQEFLFISDIKTNNIAYKLVKKFIKAGKRNDEGAWESNLSNEQVLGIMSNIRDNLRKKGRKIEIGLDIAASSFYKNKKYNYKNPSSKLNKKEQINYIKEIIEKHNVFYIEDGLDENDFSGFKELLRKVGKDKFLIVGDDLTTTNPKRLEKAIKMKAINAIIVKPNQIGSLLKVKKVVDIAKKNNIKTIISHRSGETMDNTIADLGVGLRCDFIKTGIYGKVRKSKLRRLIRIEKELKR